MAKNYVVIEEAAKMDYLCDYVALPKNYGTVEYYERADVKEIRRTVFAALDKINEKIDLNKQIGNRHIIIKPNLVAVNHKTGYDTEDMPQSTDPRVFDAIIEYLKQFSKRITIAESSGTATTAFMKIGGYDRIAQRYGCGLVAFENTPTDRYMLPKAEVMKEIVIPRILSEVVRGEAYYVSVPKMKTNLFTGVTLSFKNAMGSIPYKLRYRNHSYQIHKKLVDMLYLFKPDLVIIDGIVGAEGLTPGPVDPVDTRLIIAGNHAVEADRITTDMMGFDSSKNNLIVEAVSRGFGDSDVEIIGTPKYFKFRPADYSMISERFRGNFPRVRAFIGMMQNDKVHNITSPEQVTPELVRELEAVCVGGCNSALAWTFEMLLKGKSKKEVEVAVIYGHGIPLNGNRYYFDYQGKPYTKEDIKKLPMKKFAMGECAREAEDITDRFAPGCCNIMATSFGLSGASGVTLPIMSPANKYLLTMGASMLQTFFRKRALIKQGEYVDVEYDPKAFDKIYPIPDLPEADMQKNYIEWPRPPLTAQEKKKLLKSVSVLG